MLIPNPLVIHSAYPSHLQSILNSEQAQLSRQILQHWPLLLQDKSELISLPTLSQRIGLACIHIKDESHRSELHSFKVLGAPVALVRLILRLWPEKNFQTEGLLTGHYEKELKDFVVISATDGNHGRALAAAAQSIGCQCMIVLHAQVSQEREEAIAQYGAHIIRIPGNYDDSVRHAARLAEQNNWWVVSDTSYDNYTEVPRDVMQGYAIMAQEVVEQVDPLTQQNNDPACPYTHVFLQGGVGGLAAGVISYFWQTYGKNRPFFIAVEPDQADCILQSILHQQPTITSGSGDSLMAGLACGEVSPLAWEFLKQAIDWSISIPDDAAKVAMRQLAFPLEQHTFKDPAIVSGESGAAGLAGLLEISKNKDDLAMCQLGPNSKILLINSEGATAPSVYHEIVGLYPKDVMAQH